MNRRLPIGAEPQRDGSTHFRVWAPDAPDISLVLEPPGGLAREVALRPEADGYYSARVAGVGAGDRYRYRLADGLAADPASRYQPDGPFGPSEIVDPASFDWTDGGRPGMTLTGQIVYELHVGTFTSEGTWRAAMERLPHLAAIGVTLIEVMPIAEFPGEFGWGYDGVFPYAPVRSYGTPDDARTFVDCAHGLGLGVILDVVYNHFGPSGCVHRRFAEAYFASHYNNEWGEGLNFDGPSSGPVREYFASNAAHWIDEYHFDGLRLDATQSLHDQSDEHIIRLVTARAREAAGSRAILVVAENERQEVRIAGAPRAGGYGVDALWNDDFHHSASVALTGRREAYYSDYDGTPQEMISAARRGFLFQGQRYAWQQAPRGSRTDEMAPPAFVNFLENHDQVANSGDGSRLWQRTSPGRHRAMTALLLLLPGTPMLFQGQEFGSSKPFQYFADHEPELAAAVMAGRSEFVRQFPTLACAEMQARIPLPHARATFERCKLDWQEHDLHATVRRLHADLIKLRRREPAFRSQQPVEGAVIGPEAFVIRFQGVDPADERVLVVNFGADLTRPGFSEPLLAPPARTIWRTLWSSEHPDYGGLGFFELETKTGWTVPGHAATVLAPAELIK